MDNNRNRITSIEQFRGELQALLERARGHLLHDGSLANVALLSGYPYSKQLYVINVPHEIVNRRLRDEVRHGSYEYAFFIGLAAVARPQCDGSEPIYRAANPSQAGALPEGARLCVLVEGSHRDFGCYAAHTEVRAEGGNGYVLGHSDCGKLAGGVLADLWPKRTLNA